MRLPQVSVVIPAYNERPRVLRAVESALNQTHPPAEVIVVDDGSTDGTPDILAPLAQDGRIRLVSTPNRGVSSARNTGLSLAKHEWVAYLDADDAYEPDFLLETARAVAAHSAAHSDTSHPGHSLPENSPAATSHPAAALTFVSTNRLSGNPPRPLLTGLPTGTHDYFEAFQDLKSPAHSSSTLVHAPTLRTIGGFPTNARLFEDWTTWMALAMNGSFHFIEHPLSLLNKASTKHTTRTFDPDAIHTQIDRLVAATQANSGRYLPHDPARRRAVETCLRDIVWAICFMLALNQATAAAFTLLRRAATTHDLPVRAAEDLTKAVLLASMGVPSLIRRLFPAPVRTRLVRFYQRQLTCSLPRRSP